MEKQKICIIGGSLTGLVTALSLSKLNCDIDLIMGSNSPDPKSNQTIAISEDNLAFLKKLGVFTSIKKQLWPCSIMKLYKEIKDDEDSEIFEINNLKKKKKILYMLINAKIKKLMFKKIKKIKNISVKSNVKVSKINGTGLLKTVKINKQNSKYNLIIICTGNRSDLVKNFFNDQLIENSYNEKSITVTLKHKFIKNNTVRQFFFNNEIFALLPISNNKTSIVWSVKKNLYLNNNKMIKNKIKFYLKNFLQEIKFVSPIEYRDLSLLIRKKYYKDRILLFGDALHVVHPFVGQGFNMTLRDLSCLEKLLVNKMNLGLDIGSSDILSEFTNKTKPRNFIYSLGIDLIKNSFSLKNQPVKILRNDIFKLLNKNNLVKDFFYNIADKGFKF
mgnify:CR=1 FL=1|tara:strand:+ start:57 stop:1220 length:1164 start_codon:yes stop_codon:yes gene_type:complete